MNSNNKSNTAQAERAQVVELDTHAEPARIGVKKTYKLYINGQFPRTESGRYISCKLADQSLVNICRASRKDFREAVVAARNAQSSWAARSAYNRGQILYRVAEMLETRSAQFIEELEMLGSSRRDAQLEVAQTVDRWVYFAGWADKYQQVFSSVNPVNASYFNFSLLEPMGVVAAIAPQDSALLGLSSLAASTIVGANTCVILASQNKPLPAITLAEVFNSSDLPAGVINILTGLPSELTQHFAGHMDVNAMILCNGEESNLKEIEQESLHNLKRLISRSGQNWYQSEGDNPYLIVETQEVKTTWHPIGR